MIGTLGAPFTGGQISGQISVTLAPHVGEPVVEIMHGRDAFRLTCCEAFGLGMEGGRAYHATTDGLNYAGTGDWHIDGAGDVIRMKRVITAAPALTYEITMRPLDGVLELVTSFTNNSGSAWIYPSWADFCLQCDPDMKHSADLYDADGTHTYVPVSTGMQNMASLVDLPASGNVAHFYRPDIVSPFPVCQDGLIARSNRAGNKWVGFFSEGAPGLFANFGLGNCIHSPPAAGPLLPGSSISSRQRITFNQTTLGDVCANTRI